MNFPLSKCIGIWGCGSYHWIFFWSIFVVSGLGRRANMFNLNGSLIFARRYCLVWRNRSFKMPLSTQSCKFNVVHTQSRVQTPNNVKTYHIQARYIERQVLVCILCACLCHRVSGRRELIANHILKLIYKKNIGYHYIVLEMS